jgi:hypothetical protein
MQVGSRRVGVSYGSFRRGGYEWRRKREWTGMGYKGILYPEWVWMRGVWWEYEVEAKTENGVRLVSTQIHTDTHRYTQIHTHERLTGWSTRLEGGPLIQTLLAPELVLATLRPVFVGL